MYINLLRRKEADLRCMRGYKHQGFSLKLYIEEHCYQTHMLTADIIRELKKFDWSPEIISESADPRMIDEIYNAGFDIKPVHKTPGSINAGITKMQEYEICITRKSVNAKKEFNNYTYRQDKEGKWLNEPIDCYNHIIDGSRYVVLEKILGRNSHAYSPSQLLFGEED